MTSSLYKTSEIKLSICIATFNRAAALATTLDRVIAQATDDCEIVVSDNASTDNTEQIVAEYAQRFARLRYIRQETNKGFERNFNCAVELARGEYCWLMPDDDFLKAGAVAVVLKALRRDYSLVVVNVELTDASDVSRVALLPVLKLEGDRVYGPDEMERMFVEITMLLQYVGAIVIRKSIWVGRDKEPYFDSMFAHVGMIFQARLPGQTLVIADILISVGIGNQSWASRGFETYAVRWPSLVQSLALSESVKKRCSAQSRSLKFLMYYRAAGYYSLADYQRWLRPQLCSKVERLIPISVAFIPGVLVNSLYVLYHSVFSRADRNWMLWGLKRSRFHFRNLRRGLGRGVSASDHVGTSRPNK